MLVRSCADPLELGVIGSELRSDVATKGDESATLLLVLSRKHIRGEIGAVAHRVDGDRHGARLPPEPRK